MIAVQTRFHDKIRSSIRSEGCAPYAEVVTADPDVKIERHLARLLLTSRKQMVTAGIERSKRGLSLSGRAGETLRRLVDLVSHRSGLAIAAMNEAAVTLPQVLLLSHVERCAATSPTEIAAAMGASLPAASQMIDRLVQEGLLDRAEDPADRRRKTVATTVDARAVLRKIRTARSTEYGRGLAAVSPDLLVQMAALLERVVAQLEGARPGARQAARSTRKRK
jgi:DNA-binding MarR family transcriptional regulator